MEQQINPSRICGHWFKAGEIEKAWKMYSFRERDFWGNTGRNIKGVERWTGQDLKGKTLLLTYEQALGEQVLFASMVNELQAMGAKLILEVDHRLVSLFSNSFPDVTVVPFTNPWDYRIFSADYHCLLGNPGLRLRNTLQKFPKTNQGYLKVGCPYRPDPTFVGISWFSAPIIKGQSKSIPLYAFEPILSDKSLRTIDLQYGDVGEKDSRLLDLGPKDKSNHIYDLAFTVHMCGKIVTVSNFIAHLAGAMGKETYLLLKTGPARHWYWDMPFYPNVTRIEIEEGKEIQAVEKATQLAYNKNT